MSEPIKVTVKHLEPHMNAADGADAFHRWLTRDDQEDDR